MMTIEEIKPANNGKTENKPIKLLYTIKDTAHILSVSEKSVRRFLERGLLKTSLALRTKLITRESIENFVNATT
jgi:Helix-turn-helix domain